MIEAWKKGRECIASEDPPLLEPPRSCPSTKVSEAPDPFANNLEVSCSRRKLRGKCRLYLSARGQLPHERKSIYEVPFARSPSSAEIEQDIRCTRLAQGKELTQ